MCVFFYQTHIIRAGSRPRQQNRGASKNIAKVLRGVGGLVEDRLLAHILLLELEHAWPVVIQFQVINLAGHFGPSTRNHKLQDY